MPPPVLPRPRPRVDTARVLSAVFAVVFGAAGLGLEIWAATLIFGSGPEGCTLDCLAYPMAGFFIGGFGFALLWVAAVFGVGIRSSR